MADPDFDKVTLLYHFNEAPGAASLVDSSLYAHPSTIVGSTLVGGKFGNGLLIGDGGDKGLKVANSPDLDLGSGPFTIETFINGSFGSGAATFFGHGRGTRLSWRVTRSFNGAQISFVYSFNGTTEASIVYNNTLGGDPFQHLAITRDASNVLRLFVGGVMRAKATVVGAFHTTDADLTIGGLFTASGTGITGGKGSVVYDEFRITKGLARYASDASFTVPTAPFEGGGGTNVVASGALPPLSMGAPTGTGTGRAVGAGALPALLLAPPRGGPRQSALASGVLPGLLLTMPEVSDARATQAALVVAASSDPEARTTQAAAAVIATSAVNARTTQMALMVLAKGKEPPLVPNPLIKSDGGQSRIVDLRMVNMYVEETPDGPSRDARFGRPGLVQVVQLGPGPVRATFLHKGFRYTVSGNTVWRDSLFIGEVPGDGNLRWAISDEEIVVVAGRRAYYVTLHDVSRINDPDLPYVKDVKFLAGRFIYFDDDTSGFYRYSKLNDARNIDGLAFASAELNPDPIVGAEIQGELLAIFGTLTTEWHYPTTDASNPFKRSAGRTYDKGCLAIQTVQRADNSLFFVGHDRMVYRAASTPTRVSDHDIDNLLRKQTVEQFTANSAFKLTYGGHVFYVLNIVGQGTWAYDVAYDSWAEWKSWGRDRFRVSVSDEEGFLGDSETGAIFGVDGKRYRDLDDPIERVISTFMPLASGTLKNFNLALHTVQGVGLMPQGYGENPVVEMRFSDHLGLDFTAWMEAPLGRHQVRGREALAMWTSLGAFNHPGRVFEFRCTDPVEFSPYSASFNEARL